MKKEMLINVLQPEECRIAIVEDGVLEELYVERTSHESYTGNIYKGKIVNLEPAIQAAFVDFSVGRNGFLHVSDVEPQYFHRHPPGDEEPESRTRGRDRDRGKKREPRRDHGRGREDRRPGLTSNPVDLPPPFPSPPPRIEERPRDRDRGRDRERPDQSIRGRRDRSEPPRRFGEGLADQDADSMSQPLSAEPPPESAGLPVLGRLLHRSVRTSGAQHLAHGRRTRLGRGDRLATRAGARTDIGLWPDPESRHDEPTEPPPRLRRRGTLRSRPAP